MGLGLGAVYLLCPVVRRSEYSIYGEVSDREEESVRDSALL